MKSILTLLLAIISTIGYTQMYLNDDFEYEIGVPYDYTKSSYHCYNIYENNCLLKLQKIRGGTINIQKFSTKDMKLMNKNIIEDMPGSYNIEHITLYNNKHFLFYSRWERDLQEYHLFYREIDFDNSNLKEETTMLIQIMGKKGGAFEFYYSNDSSNMLIKYRKSPIIKDDALSKEVNGLYIFNIQMQETSGKEVTMPYTERVMDNLDYTIDNDGNIYIITRVYHDNSAKMKIINGKPNYHLELLRYQKESDKQELFFISVGKQILNSVKLFINKNQEIICVGLSANVIYQKFKNSPGHAEFSDNDFITGIHICRLNKDGELMNQDLIEFPEDYQDQFSRYYIKTKRREELERGLKGLKLKDFYFDKDGSIIITGEQEYETGHPSRFTYHHFNNILICSISPQGILKWMQKLPKRQYVIKERKGDLSYKQLCFGNSQYLVFIDNVKNFKIPYDEPLNQYVGMNGGYLTAYKVNNDTGKFEKLMILYTKNLKGVNFEKFINSKIVAITDDEFIFEVGKKKKENVLLKVKLKPNM